MRRTRSPTTTRPPTAGTLYYYWVSATNASGSSAKSTSNSGFKRLTAPANLAAADGASTANVAVTWDAVTGANSYHLYRDTDSDPSGATGLGPQTSGYADTPTPGHPLLLLGAGIEQPHHQHQRLEHGGFRLPQAADRGRRGGDEQFDRQGDGDVDGQRRRRDGLYGLAPHRGRVRIGDADQRGGAGGGYRLSYDDTTAVAGTPYWYWVRATNSTSTSQSDFSTSDARPAAADGADHGGLGDHLQQPGDDLV